MHSIRTLCRYAPQLASATRCNVGMRQFSRSARILDESLKNRASSADSSNYTMDPQEKSKDVPVVLSTETETAETQTADSSTPSVMNFSNKMSKESVVPDAPHVSKISRNSKFSDGDHPFAKSAEKKSDAPVIIKNLEDLKLTKRVDNLVIEALGRAGFNDFTPVQSQALIPIIDEPKGIVVRAQTGTGKTLTFIIPTLNLVTEEVTKLRPGEYSKSASTLVIAPTRDLAMQIEAEYKKVWSRMDSKWRLKISIDLMIGGHRSKVNAHRPPSVIVATPGRLLANLKEPRFERAMSNIKYRVYDEADRLLDDGFKDELDSIDEILRDAHEKYHPDTPGFKSILFSATVDQSVSRFAKSQIGNDYTYINCVSKEDGEAHKNIHQVLVKTPDISGSWNGALEYIFEGFGKPGFKSIVFLPTVFSVDLFYQALKSAQQKRLLPRAEGRSPVILRLHGKMTQSARDRLVRSFREAKDGVFVSTDVAARGLDFNDVSDVIQVAPSSEPADYTHKVGRTARAGAKGKATLFLAQNQMKYKSILEKDRGIVFAEEKELADSETNYEGGAFSHVEVDEDLAREFITSFLSAQKQLDSKYRSNYERTMAESMTFYRQLTKDPEARLRVSATFVKKAYGVEPHRVSDIFEITGLSSYEGSRNMGNNRSYKRNTFDGRQSSGSDRRSSYSGSNHSYSDRGSSYGDQGSYGERRSYGDRGDRKSYGDRADRKSYGDRGDRKYSGGKRSYGDRKPSGDRESPRRNNEDIMDW